MAMRSAGRRLLGGGSALPEGFGYSVKRRLLGPPLVNLELAEQRLSKPLALGLARIGSLTGPGKTTVEGRIFAVEIRPEDGSNVLATEIADSTGELTALFYGRSYIPGMDCGGRVRFRGRVSLHEGRPVMINPAYELIGPGGQERPAPRRGLQNGGWRRNHRRMPGDQT